jgi:hypothetical protein
MHFIYNGLFLIAGIIWGDWKQWRDYYPTILYYIIGDLLKFALLYHYTMWTYQETIMGESILRNHTIISIMIMVIVYPSTILIYLGRFPQTRWRKLAWISFWTILYTSVEFINEKYLNLINHHHGWNIGWSLLFNFVMFTLLRIHFKNPLLAWGLSIPWVIFLLNVFNVPIDRMK